MGRRASRPPPRVDGDARLAVNLPVELHRQLKARAAEQGLTMRQYILSLLEREGIARR